MASFHHRFVVRFAEVDHAKIVYYPQFYHYFHVGFEEFFRERMGVAAYLDLLDNRRIGLPAVHSQCDHVAPLRFSDLAEVVLVDAKVGTKSVTVHYEVRRLVAGNEAGIEPNSRDFILCARGHVACCATDLDTFQSIEVPKDLRTLFLELSPTVR